MIGKEGEKGMRKQEDGGWIEKDMAMRMKKGETDELKKERGEGEVREEREKRKRIKEERQ